MIKDNIFDKGTIPIVDVRLDLTSRSSQSLIINNKFNTSSDKNIIYCTGNSNDDAYLLIEKNMISHSVSNASVNGLINIVNQSNVTIQDNNILSSKAASVFSITSNGNILSNVVIRNNRISTVNSGGYVIILGTDGSGANDYKITNAVVTGNFISGSRVVDTYSTTHSLMFGYTVGSECRWNCIENAGCGIVVKGTNNPLDSGVFAYNLLTNCNAGIIIKGCRNNKFIGNTIVTSHTNSLFYGIEFVKQTTSITQGNEILNNIIYCLGNNPHGHCIWFADSEEHSNHLDNNNYYNFNPGLMCRDVSTNMNFDEFRLIGDPDYEQNGSSEVIIPVMTNFVPVSPITVAAELDTSINAGLDASYPSWTILPPPTRSQGSQWQNGCYIR